jgi:hypothetical protein
MMMRSRETVSAGLSYPIAVILAQAPATMNQPANEPNVSKQVCVVSTTISGDAFGSGDVFGSVRLAQDGFPFVQRDILDDAKKASSAQLDEAEEKANELQNERMRAEALDVVAKLQEQIAVLNGTPPTISISHPDDGSFVIDFVAQGVRAGYTIEPEEGQSGWFYASLVGSNHVSASGSLEFMEPIDLLKRLVDDPSRSTA